MKIIISTILILFLGIPILAQVDGFPVSLGTGDEPLWGAPAIVKTDSASFIAIGSTDDSLYLINTNGSFVDGFPIALSGHITSKVAWEPCDSGIFIFVLSENGILTKIMWDGTTAAVEWTITLGENSRYISPVLGEDDDGNLEIFSAVDTTLFCCSSDGDVLWSADFSSSTGSAVATPSCGDIDGDGEDEIIVEGYEKIFAFNPDGSPVDGFPLELVDAAFSYSSPFLWDCDDDGAMEIFCGAHQITGGEYGVVYRIDADEPSLDSPIFTITGAYGTWLYSSPAIGDVNGDYSYDITFGSINGTVFSIDGSGALASFGGVALHMSYGHIYGGIMLCDIDNSAGPEFIFQMSQESSELAYLIAMDPGALYPENFPDTMAESDAGILSPAVFEDDSSTKIVAATGSGDLYLWEIDNKPLAGYKFWTEMFGDRRNRNVAIPDVPELTAEISDGNFILRWSMSGSGDFLRYIVYQSGDSAGTSPAPLDTIYEIADTEYIIDADTSSDSLWYFVVVEDFLGRTSGRSVPQFICDTSAIANKTPEPEKTTITVSPSPFNSICKIVAPKAEKIVVSTIDGRTVDVIDGEGGVFHLDGKNLPSGILLLSALDDKGRILSSRRTILIK